MMGMNLNGEIEGFPESLSTSARLLSTVASGVGSIDLFLILSESLHMCWAETMLIIGPLFF